jgi:RNA polymerase sigma-70 factor, ECF subfamily
MITMLAAVTTGACESVTDDAAGITAPSPSWSSLHHAATLLSLDDGSLVACAVGTHETAPDPEAFGVLYERYVHRIFAFAFSRLHDRTQAEDITSQTFLQALQALPRYQQRGVPIRYWLLTIAANAIYGLHRASPGTALRLGCTDPYERDAHGGTPVLDLPDPDAEAEIAAGEWAEDLRNLLSTLSPAQRTVIHLRFSAGLGIAAIATRMGCTVGAVKALQFRGVQGLRRRWEKEFAVGPVAARRGSVRDHAHHRTTALGSRASGR